MEAARLPVKSRLVQVVESTWYSALIGTLWGAAVVLLPVTSLPFLLHLAGATTVAPPSSALFLLIALVWAAPFVLAGGRLPVEGKPLLVFLAVVGFSWGAAFFLQRPSFRSAAMLSEAPEAFATLLMGLAAYFVPAAWVSVGKGRLANARRLINLSGVILLAWSLAQAYVVLFRDGSYPGWIVQVQEALSTRHNPLFDSRLTGFAYEPSWLAHMLALVYLPFWLATVITRSSAHRFHIGWFTAEDFLLAGGVFTLLLSLSRVGILSFTLMVAFLALQLMYRLSGRISGWLLAKFGVQTEGSGKSSSARRLLRSAISLLSGLVLLVLLLSLAAGFFYGASRFDDRMRRVFENDFFSAGSFYQLTNQLAFAERVVYWSTGLNIFEEHPVLGVGLGNAGFYFSEEMPTFGYALWEVSRMFGFEDALPNTKSMWVRVLAETGLVGFAVFAAWCFLLWQTGKLCRQMKSPALRAVGLAGQLALVAFLAEGFSVDSFALPYIWFSKGLLSAAGYMARRELLSTG